MTLRISVAEIESIGGLNEQVEGTPDDIFLSCASYEPRTTAVARSLSKSYKCKFGLIYYNREFLTEHPGGPAEKNFGVLKAKLEEHCEVVESIDGSWSDARDQFLSLRSALQREGAIGDKPKVTLDTTTFNREALIVSLAILRDTYPQAKIRLIYVSPAQHGEWLSRGFHEVRSVVGFPGIQLANRQTVLAVLSGFEPDRVNKIIEEHEPSVVFLGIGSPPTNEEFLNRNLLEQRELSLRSDVVNFQFPANNVGDCLASLELELGPQVTSSNLVLAPMSTKLSTIAAYLFAELHTEVQLAYCLPGEYNTDSYSSGAKDLFIYELYPSGATTGE